MQTVCEREERFGRPQIGRPRVLHLAFACRPDKGSEPAVGWNRAIQSAKSFDTWVICDEAENREAVERYVAKHGAIPGLEFVFLGPGSGLEQRFWKAPGLFYLAYKMWHRRAFEAARRLHRQLEFDLVHQVNFCGFREPGYLWKLGAPWVWGPVGGAQNLPWRFLRCAGLRGALVEGVRSTLNAIQIRFSPRVRKAAKKSSMLLFATRTNQRALAHLKPSRSALFIETGIEVGENQNAAREFSHAGPLRILWSGALRHHKALYLLLRALAQVPADVPFELRILGDGPLEQRWKKMAARLGIAAHCQWQGWLDRTRAIEHYAWADVFAFTSLRDTTGQVVLESLVVGTPVLCLDHQGVADMVTSDCGVMIPVTTPARVIQELAAAVTRLSRNRDELRRLSAGAFQRAKVFDWNRLGDKMAGVYREVLRGSGRAFVPNASSANADAFEREPVLSLDNAGEGN